MVTKGILLKSILFAFSSVYLQMIREFFLKIALQTILRIKKMMVQTCLYV